MKRSSVAIIVAVFIILGIGIWLVARPKPEATTEVAKPTPPPATEQPAQPPAGAIVVSYDDNGFSPAKATVKSGQTLTFTNKASSDIQPSSDPHPQHTDNPELNVGNIAAGQSKSITPTKTGTFGMHDHFNPSHTMSITIE